jgi:hypothetical protein
MPSSHTALAQSWYSTASGAVAAYSNGLGARLGAHRATLDAAGETEAPATKAAGTERRQALEAAAVEQAVTAWSLCGAAYV